MEHKINACEVLRRGKDMEIYTQACILSVLEEYATVRPDKSQYCNKYIKSYDRIERLGQSVMGIQKRTR